MGSETNNAKPHYGTSMTVMVVFAWYCSNIGMLLLNKAVLSSFDFRYPIFLTACHQACGTLMSMFFSTIGCMPRQRITSRKQLYKIAVLATVFCASIVSNNASMRYIAVSFNQAIGATTPAITAVMAYFMLNTRESRQTYMTLVPVVLGIIVASGWEPNFNMLGFLLCLTATTTRSFKTVLQALLLSDPAERLSSMSLMYYMSPIALAVSLPLALLFEDAPWVRAAALMQANPKFAWAFVANVLLSYCINLTNFLATQYTSALTIQVLGNAKGAVAVVVSIMVFRNPSKRHAKMAATLRQTKDTLAKLADDVEEGRGYATGKTEGMAALQQRIAVNVHT